MAPLTFFCSVSDVVLCLLVCSRLFRMFCKPKQVNSG